MSVALLQGRGRMLGVVALGAIVAGVWWARSSTEAPATAAIKPALTVTVATPRQEDWPQRLAIDGNVTAWQEAVIGAELGQFRIAEVNVQVGDRVAKGQVLARIADDAVAAELDEAKAVVEELTAFAGEAKANAERAQALRAQGFYSPQTNTQYVTGERTSAARVAGAQARLESAELRMSKTRVTAPDDGVISARTATVGSLTQPGQELFRLIRGGRIEWQAEVPAALLAHVKAGAPAQVAGPDGRSVAGKVRAVAPSVDPRTRNGIVYVDLPAQSSGGLRAGMFARGEIETGRAPALSVPASAVVLREGFAYVFGVAGEPPRVAQIRVKTGRRNGDRIEIVEGLKPDVRIVDTGAGFLADGDVVAMGVAAAPAPSRAAAN